MILLAIFLVVGLGILAVAVLATAVIGPYVVAYLVGRKIDDAAAQKDSNGQRIQRSLISQAGIGNLPLPLSFVAGLGNDAQPEKSAHALVLRPTWGQRMISFVLSALLIGLVYIGWGDLVPASPYTWPIVLILLAYGVLATNIYELRYDADGFVSSGFGRSRKEIMWKDLSRFTDNGHYLYTFTTFTGQKVEVPKYLVGIREFLSYAKAQMEYHDRH